MTTDARQFAPAAARNRDALLEALRPRFPSSGLFLEIASGSGEHAVHFAAHAAPGLRFQPSDPDPQARASIDAWIAATGLPNVLPALEIDAASDEWRVERADAVFNANMIHISPWEAAVGLVAGAARTLRAGGELLLYGPYKIDGRHISEGNASFDADLRARDPAWGIRDLGEVAALAASHGFSAAQVIDMPANNKTVAFRKL